MTLTPEQRYTVIRIYREKTAGYECKARLALVKGDLTTYLQELEQARLHRRELERLEQSR